MFLSSDSGSVSLGNYWLDNITTGLRECILMIVFCSSYSIQRSWINFECGAGWGRGIDIIPICHSGLRPVDLPLPISLLQGFSIDQTVKLQEVFDAIAKKLELNPPQMDTQLISVQCNQFQSEYSKNQTIKLYLIQIKEKQPSLWEIFQEYINKLNSGNRSNVITISDYAQIDCQKIEQYLEKLQENKYLEFSFKTMGMWFGQGSKGNYGSLQLQFSDEAIDVLKILV